MPPELPPNFQPDAYSGLVDDYVRYRVPYPPAMLEEMLARVALPSSPRLLDLACGPGRLTLAIAPRFAEVLAVDQEPDMVAAGARLAAERGLTQIRWKVGRVEDLALAAGSFQLVTAAEAFHRMEQAKVAAAVFSWLAPGGAFVTMGFEPATGGGTRWRRVLADVVQRYVGTPAQRLGDAPGAPPPADPVGDQNRVQRAAGFDPVEDFSVVVAHEWTLEALLGNLRSLSITSPRALGERHRAFEADLSAALRAFDPAGRYVEDLRCGYTVARKPL
ncbi:MAG TPA: class I SAM-dependent methyltransferase [Caulobacteraceae bacterium]|jgi:SAM-dependent methyltransferase